VPGRAFFGLTFTKSPSIFAPFLSDCLICASGCQYRNPDHSGYGGYLLTPVFEGGLGNPWEPFGPVMAAAGNQPDANAVALYSQAVTVIFDFVEPVRAGGHGLADGGDAKLKLGHGPKIGLQRGF
jgi:hypothetical protein